MPHTLSRALRRATLAAAVACLLSPALAARGGDGEMPGEILLKLKSSAALPALLAKYPVTLVATLGPRPIYRLKVIGGAPPKDVIAALELEPGVQIAEPNPLQQAPEARKNIAWAIGTESEYRAQWAPQAIRLPEAHARSQGAGVRVAVLDTGVDYQHPALAGHLLPGHDFVDGDSDASEAGGVANPAFGHGTHVAGLVLLAAPAVQVMPLRVLDPDGVGHVWSLAEAMVHAIDPDRNPATDDGAQIINLSLGTLTKTRLFDTLDQIVSCGTPARDPARDVSDPGYADDKARCKARRGALVVAAAGNGASASAREYPAAESAYGVLSVAASDDTRQLADFSNSGGWIELVAPGAGLTSTMAGGGYATWSGTSMASPLAAGAGALLRAIDAVITPKDIVRRMQETSALLCGTRLRQLDAAALLTQLVPPDLPCP